MFKSFLRRCKNFFLAPKMLSADDYQTQEHIIRARLKAQILPAPLPYGKTFHDILEGLVLDQKRVVITLQVTPDWIARHGKAMETQIKKLEQQLETTLQGRKILISLTAHSSEIRSNTSPVPKPPRKPSSPAPAILSPRPARKATIARHILAVASGKGGVGKSTVTANLALALAQKDRKVAILDADVYGPSMAKVFGISKPPQMTKGEKTKPPEVGGVQIMSMGFLIKEDTPMVWRGPMVTGALMDMINSVNWGNPDILLIDMPPGTGDIQLTLAQQLGLTGAVIVSTPQDLALLDARKAMSMFVKLHVPILGLVENMSQFICPHCGEPSYLFDHSGVAREAEKQRLVFLGALPLHISIREGCDQGKPVMLVDPDGTGGKAFKALADKLHKQLQEPSSLTSKPELGLEPDQPRPQNWDRLNPFEQDDGLKVPQRLTAIDKGQALRLDYQDATSAYLSAEFLRVHSPSAEVQGHGPDQKITVTGKENIRISNLKPVGSYAVQIIFDDGHQTGYYTFDYLKELVQNRDSLWQAYCEAVAEKNLARD
jgi:ATP-binding protein involved in chromosome partitioning